MPLLIEDPKKSKTKKRKRKKHTHNRMKLALESQYVLRNDIIHSFQGSN